MRVAITGGTGFVGPAVIRELLDAGHHVTVLEHRTPVRVPDHPNLTRAKGDVTDRASLEKAFAGNEAVIHMVAILAEKPDHGITFERIHVEGARNAVQAATGVGVSRFLLMSANGVGDPTMPSTPYFETKAEMERIVKEGPFHWTIFRPSFISSDAQGGFDDQFVELVDKLPVLPSFDGGRFMIQPVARKTVAEAFARALTEPESYYKVYTLVGPERFTWNEYLRRLSRLRGKHRLRVWAPSAAVAFVADKMPALMPAEANADQLRMLVAGNVGDPSEVVRDLDLRLIPWEQAVAGFAR